MSQRHKNNNISEESNEDLSKKLDKIFAINYAALRECIGLDFFPKKSNFRQIRRGQKFKTIKVSSKWSNANYQKLTSIKSMVITNVPLKQKNNFRFLIWCIFYE